MNLHQTPKDGAILDINFPARIMMIAFGQAKEVVPDITSASE
jgi:hypothetical protein